MVEFSFENKRTSDLRRTRNWHKLTGEFLEVYQVLVAGETGADRTAKINELEAIDPDTGQPFRDGLDLNDRNVYLEYFQPHYIVPQGNGFRAMNIPEYHNFYTFHNDFVRRGVNIETTIGWEGGTFDPLDD